MSKKQNNTNIFDVGNADPVKIISEHISKKGKLKGSKKEIKSLKAICPHHRYTKKGKKRFTVTRAGGNTMRCTLCGKTWKADFYKPENLNKRVDECAEVVDQMKFMAQAIGAGKESVREVTNISIHLGRIKKMYKKLQNVAAKRDKIKNKKNKKKTSANSYGSWG